MARKAREKSSTGIYHIILRATNKLFLDDNDKDYFSSLMKQILKDGASVYGYRAEDTRVHIILKENTKNISEVLKPFCTSYARYFNRTHNIDGKLFDGRFKSEPIEDDVQLAKTIKYLYRDNIDLFYNDSIINHKELKNIVPEKVDSYLAMDEYSSMTASELKSVIKYLCNDVKGFSKLSDVEKIEAVKTLDSASRLKIGAIRDALGLEEVKTAPKKSKSKAKSVPKKADKKPPKKPATVKVPVEKPIEEKQKTSNQNNKQQKKDLPIWLL